MPLKKYPSNNVIVDGENVPVRLDFAYAISDISVGEAINEIKSIHGLNVCLLPLSGCSAGAGVFQVSPPANAVIVGLHLSASLQPRVWTASDVDIRAVNLDEIVIDVQNRQVYAGSAINLNQLNQALAAELGAQFRVLGADLTSYTYAQVGATFMTGGMGPQRRYFSDSVFQISLYDGNKLEVIEADQLSDYAGTYGWSGLVSAVCCEYCELPIHEVAFAIPVNNTATDLARLLQHFSVFTQLNIEDGKVSNTQAGSDLILGLEHITIDSMQPFLSSGENALTDRARQLQQNCEAASADGLIFVNGYSNLPVDDFLLNLVDDATADEFTIAGINLEFTEVFKDPEQMRAVREAIPFAARTQSPKGRFIYKGHTDANIRLNPQAVETAMFQFWKANEDYVQSVRAYFNRSQTIRGEILVYGHLNPVGVDPHNRITFACDDEAEFKQSSEQLEVLRDDFIRRLAVICKTTDSQFIGGEKSVGSEYEMIPAFDHQNEIPALLAEKFKRQKKVIRAAAKLFNWRALSPYSESNEAENHIG